MADSPELAAAKRLLDDAKPWGFGSSGWYRGRTARCGGFGTLPNTVMRFTWLGSPHPSRVPRSGAVAPG